MWLLNMTHILAVLLLLRQVCDKGNLRQAMRRGLLHKRTANKGLVVDMRLLVTVRRMAYDGLIGQSVRVS